MRTPQVGDLWKFTSGENYNIWKIITKERGDNRAIVVETTGLVMVGKEARLGSDSNIIDGYSFVSSKSQDFSDIYLKLSS
jgi:hypothetical protein